MTSIAPAGQVERALEALFRLGANRRFDSRQEAAVGASVTRAGYAVLRCLDDAEQMGLAAVADECVMDAATASRQVERLVKDGLVSRRSAEEDARAVVLTITPRGVEIYQAVVAHRLEYLGRALGEWDHDELAGLAATIERLAADLAVAPLSPDR